MKRFVVVGGGAAGFFAATACAEACARAGIEAETILLEKGPEVLAKVRISGGGRCNVTHACFDGRTLAGNYPRGGRALIGPFSRFQPADTIAWFADRGVKLKTEDDGRMFPVTDSSATIIDCLTGAARDAGVRLWTHCGLSAAARRPGGGFRLTLSNGSAMECDCLLLSTGGCRGTAATEPAVSLGHTLEPPVPSLFTFHIETPWLRELAGLSVDPVEVTVPGTGLRQRGALLATHWGVSGPAILRLSAWGARVLHGMNYRFPLRVRWLPDRTADSIAAELTARRESQPTAQVMRTPLRPIPTRLWERLGTLAGVEPSVRWGGLPKTALNGLAARLAATDFAVTGKSANKAEFVTCGGVRLAEVDFRTMESRVCPGLYLAGELLDIDGVTGGFNFQAAWTTGWIAGHAMAGVPTASRS